MEPPKYLSPPALGREKYRRFGPLTLENSWIGRILWHSQGLSANNGFPAYTGPLPNLQVAFNNLILKEIL